MSVENESKIKHEHAESVDRTKSMLKRGIDTDKIMEITSLSREEIEELKERISDRLFD